jgi:hypothetical protein
VSVQTRVRRKNLRPRQPFNQPYRHRFKESTQNDLISQLFSSKLSAKHCRRNRRRLLAQNCLRIQRSPVRHRRAHRLGRSPHRHRRPRSLLPRRGRPLRLRIFCRTRSQAPAYLLITRCRNEACPCGRWQRLLGRDSTCRRFRSRLKNLTSTSGRSSGMQRRWISRLRASRRARR